MVERQSQDAETSPFTIVPKSVEPYVIDGKISDRAAWLYVVLLGYHNQTRGDDYVWPSRKTLAMKCGLKKPEGVDRLLKELQAAGLIFSEQRRQQGVNLPSRHKLMLNSKNMGVTPSQVVPPTSAQGVTPDEGGGVTPDEGYELEVLELDELEVQNPLSQSDDTVEPEDLKTAPTTELSETDYASFAQAVGEKFLWADGTYWPKDVYGLDEIYFDMIEANDEAALKPGEEVQEIEFRGGAPAVTDWLTEYGLMRDSWVSADEQLEVAA